MAPFMPHGMDPGWKRFPNPSTHSECVDTLCADPAASPQASVQDGAAASSLALGNSSSSQGKAGAPPFCRQLRPQCPTELGPTPTAFKDSCLPPCPHWGGFSPSVLSIPPLPFFSIASTSFTSSGGATSGGLNCSCKSGRGEPGGEGGREGSAPAQPPAHALQWSRVRAQPTLLPTAASESEESCGPCQETAAHANTARRPRGTAQLARKLAQHLLSLALL